MSEVIVWRDFPPVETKSRYTGELEKTRKDVVDTIAKILLPTSIITLTATSSAFAESTATAANDIRDSFMKILDVFTAIAEPILWFYALTACILIATKNKDTGWNRLKQVAYAYAGIALLPTFFAFLRWIADLLKGAISF